MTHFEGGPAQGQTLMLKRSPILLRVVLGLEGFDALDQLGDEPRPDERVYLYRLQREPGWMHLNCRGTKNPKAGGRYPVATYEYLPSDQPPDEAMRSTHAWVAWCRVNQDRLMPAWMAGKTAVSP